MPFIYFAAVELCLQLINMKVSEVYKMVKYAFGKGINFICILHCSTHIEMYSDVAAVQICNDVCGLSVDYYIFKE
jgi:hypothetical protein